MTTGTWTPTPQSSNVAGFSYDSENRVLMIGFKNNSLYEYDDVPHWIYAGLKSADSKGSYVASHIKGHYSYARVA